MRDGSNVTLRAASEAIHALLRLKVSLRHVPALINVLEGRSSGGGGGGGGSGKRDIGSRTGKISNRKQHEPFRGALLSGVAAALRRACFTDIARILDNALEEGEVDISSASSSSAALTVRICFCVREGTSGLLDVARVTYTQSLEQVHELFQYYRESGMDAGNGGVASAEGGMGEDFRSYSSFGVEARPLPPDICGFGFPSLSLKVSRALGLVSCLSHILFCTLSALHTILN